MKRRIVPGRLVAVCLAAAVLAPGLAGAWEKSCNELQQTSIQNGRLLEDGVWWIYSANDQVRYRVYCRDMKTDPKDYLILSGQPGTNFSQFTVGGTVAETTYRKVTGSTLTTTFSMIRFDPINLLVDIGDLTYASTTGGPVSFVENWPMMGGATVTVTVMPYGVAADCGGPRWWTGRANIDLTGTPFVVDADFQTSDGYMSNGYVTPAGGTTTGLGTVHVTSKIVNLSGGGYCGGAGPRGHGSTFNAWVRAEPERAKLALKLKLQP